MCEPKAPYTGIAAGNRGPSTLLGFALLRSAMTKVFRCKVAQLMLRRFKTYYFRPGFGG